MKNACKKIKWQLIKVDQLNRYLLAALIFPTGRPDIEIHQFKLVDVHKQKKRMEMNSEQASIFQKLNLNTLRKPVTLLWGNKSEPYNIQANDGVIQSLTQDMSLRNNCTLVSPDGILFQTESLDYENSTALLTSADPIKAQKGSDIELSGLGLRIEIKKDIYQILSQVQAQRRSTKNQNLKILASQASIQPSANLATFLGNVRVYSEKMELVGDILKTFFHQTSKESKKSGKPTKQNTQSGDIEKLQLLSNSTKKNSKIIAKLEKVDLYSEGLDVFFSPSGEIDKMEAVGQVDALTRDNIRMRSEKLIYLTHPEDATKDRLFLQGNVHIETQDRIAECQEAEFDPLSGQIILTRVATVKKDNQLLRGERIRFSTKDSEVYVEQASGKLQRQSLGF
jgi:LPS export ABC transporter protein LptC